MNLLFLLEFALVLSSAVADPVSSFESSILRARQAQEESSLPLLIYFSSEDCAACAEFNALFKEPNVLQQMEKHYVSVHVSIDDFDGKACADIYHVRTVPAFVVADNAGVILYKSDETLSVQDVRLLLESVPGAYPSVPDQTHSTSGLEIPSNPDTDMASAVITEDNSASESSTTLPEEYVPVTLVPQHMSSDKPAEISASQDPEVQPDLPQSTLTSEVHAIASHVAVDEELGTESTPNDLPAVSHAIYAVQLGFFSDQSNASKLMDRAQQKSLPEVRMENVVRNGQTFYRVLTGAFNSLTRTQSFISNLTAQGMKGAVYRL